MLSLYHDVFMKYFRSTGFSLHACDTDSLICAFSSKDLEDCCKSEMVQEYREKKIEIFVPTEGPLVQWLSKEPLLLKTETSADFSISLSPKSYFMLSLEDVSCKAASKGISRMEQNLNLLTLKAYFDCLFDRQEENDMKVLHRGIRFGDGGELVTYSQTKNGLSALSPKFHLCSCRVHCFPREITSNEALFNEIYPYACAISASDAWVFIKSKIEAQNSPFLSASAGLTSSI